MAAASLWVVAALILFMYIVFKFISSADDPNALPLNILIASDHSVYIGVITNGALGLLSIVALSRPNAGPGSPTSSSGASTWGCWCSSSG